MSTIEPQPKRQKISDEISRKLDRIDLHNQKNKTIPLNDLYELSENIGNHICALRLSDNELDDTTFSYFTENLPNLSKLIIEKCENISHQIFGSLPNLPGLTELHVSNCPGILNSQLYKFVKEQTQLSVLEIEEEYEDKNKSFTATKLSNESAFSKIRIKGSCNFTDKKLNSIIEKLTKLTKLKIVGCLQITERSIRHLPNHPSLLHLEIKGCHSSINQKIDNPNQVNVFSIPPDIWQQIIPYFYTNIKDLNNFVTNKNFYQIYAEERFSRLNKGAIRFVYSQELAPYFCDLIKNKFTNLSYFNPPSELDASFYECLPSLTNLSNLDLSCGKINNSSLPYLKALTRLTHLNLREIKTIADEELSSIAHLTKLRYLNLRGLQISEIGLGSISQLTNLTCLNLGDNAKINDLALKRIFHFTNLTYLSVQCTNITDREINSFTNLTHLNLRQIQIINKNSVNIKNLTKLKYLSLNNNSIGDDAVNSISTLTNLTKLNIFEGNEISFRGCKQLVSFKDLSHTSMNFLRADNM